MRSASILRWLALPLLAAATAVSPAGGWTGSEGRIETSADELSVRKLFKRDESLSGGKMDGDLSSTTDGGATDFTTFNGKRVPPLTELEGAKFDETVKDGYWLVEFFSPYCHHCKAFAPTWQTLYEFYYTSEPLPQTPGSGETHNDMNSFTRYYNFKFAKIDCVANGDACSKKGIGSFPTIKLFKDGKEVETKVGAKDMNTMSNWIEQILESFKPGSRPAGGPKLPKVGAKEAPAQPAVAPVPKVGGPAKTTISGTRIVPLPQQTPNPSGASQPLTALDFQNKVTTTHDPWFVKFYAPWCHHCQAMAPNWQGMARQMQGELNVGEVNCDVEKRLCKDVKVRGYPTILFFQGGERIEYDGLRGLGDLISFANKALAVKEGVPSVTAAEFEELEKKEEVIFLYFYDDATTSEDFAAVERLVLSLIGHAKLVKTSDPALCKRFKISTWPRLVVSRDGKPSYYNALSPREMRDFRRVLNWMKTVWLPIVPELTASNAREIMDGKLVVLGILSRDRPEELTASKREIKNAALEWIDKQIQAFQLERQELRDAKQLRIEEAEDRNDQKALRAAKSIRINMDDIERKEVGFAWVDGVFWERWIRTTFGISVADGEKVIVNDEANHRYWDVTMTGNPIVPSRTSILETLPRIVANPPKIAAKSTTSALGHLWWVVKGQIWEHPLVSAGILIGILAVGFIYGKKHLPSQGGYIKLTEKGGMNGLLGGNAGNGQGKTD
ncbi:disulfide isomerase [Lecanosticta acicola]|uniref:Disulfide isomerase n=1 Tax=Lecanosticta acicola TaxID=111012 RepID=A0AAI9EB29_9PEZI|nr:disulfide isomerase [Lecanosticta acicola]